MCRGWELVLKDNRSRTERNPYRRPLTSWLRGANGSMGLGIGVEGCGGRSLAAAVDASMTVVRDGGGGVGEAGDLK